MRMFSAVIIRRIWGIVFAFTCVGVSASAQASSTIATHPVVQLGQGSVDGMGTSHVTVNQATPLLGINWTSLGNNPGEVLKFVQPSASAIALNRVTGADPSQFLGSLFANGSVIVINPNGVFFGPHSQVNVNGLIASSLNMTDSDFLKGQYAFQGTATNGAVRNEGQITAGPFGVYLLASNVTNNGVIRSPGGHIALAAGTTAYLSDRADGRGFLVEVKAPAGEALNLGNLIADGGQVSMIGRLVTQSGVVQANSVKQKNGTIELVASERITLRAGSVTRAKGDAEGISDGGTVRAIADKTAGRMSLDKGAVIDVSGGVQGGNAGFVELSGAQVTMPGSIFGRTALGSYRGGTLLIDPIDLTIDTAYFQTVLTPLVHQGMTNLVMQADNDLTVTARVNVGTAGQGILGWNLPAGQAGTLLFSAGHNLTFNNALILNGLPSGQGLGGNWTYSGTAGNDIVFNATTFQAGNGGSINLQAGQDIKLVPDGGGGFTTLQTFAGNITINAGRDLIAPFGRQSNGQYAGIRLQGVGDLSITTGRDFLGGVMGAAAAGPGFLLSNGTAHVTVGGNFGSLYVPGSPDTTGPPNGYASLMLGSGTFNTNTGQVVPGSQGIAKINVTAGGNIYLGGVQDTGAAEGFGRSQFNAVTVHPENSASLTARTGNIFLNPADSNIDLPLTHVLPPTFNAAAPNGTIFIQTDRLDFWPSAPGNVVFSAGNNIQGTLGSTGFSTTVSLCQNLCPDISVGVAQQPGSISFTTATGDITALNFQLFNPVVTKSTIISSGRDITNIFGQAIPVPDLGTDAAGNRIPGATISAVRDIDLTTPAAAVGISGLTFVGTGMARISAGRTLDLANSQGIIQRVNISPTNDANKGGLLDIAVGGDLKMSKSRILSENGASIFVHGLGVNRLNSQAVLFDGATQVATTATLGTMTFQGQTVLAVGGQPVFRSDGSLIVVDPKNPDPFVQDKIGKPVYLVDGRAALGVDQLPLLVDPGDAIAGKQVLLVGGTPAFGISNKLIVVNPTAPASFTGADLSYGTLVLDRTPVRLTDGTIVVVANGKVSLARDTSAGSAVDGQPTIANGSLGLLVGNRPASLLEPLGGSINVGTSQRSASDATGIVTLRGGSITAKAAGDINVEFSRIAAFGSGDMKGGSITLISTGTPTSSSPSPFTGGDINAGFGSRNDMVQFTIDQGVKLDAQGNPVINPNTGRPEHILFAALVPASGIFTFHANDPLPLNFPVFNPVSPFESLVRAHELFGHNVSVLLPQIPAAQAAWKAQYEQTFLKFIADKKLGDVTLTAAKDVVIPTGGLRGALIQVNAGRSFNVSGKVEGLLSAQTPFFFGNFANLIGLFNIGGLSGSQSSLTLQSVTSPSNPVTISTSSSASATVVAATNVKAEEEATATPEEATARVMAKSGAGKGEGGQKGASLRVKDKVRIKVETRREPVAQ